MMNSHRLLLAAALVAFSSAAIGATDAPSLAAGDTWSYRETNVYNGLPRGTWTRTVTAASPGDIRVELRGDGGATSEPLVLAAPGRLAAGALSPRARGKLEPALQLLPFPLEEGQRWRQLVTRSDLVTHQRREVQVLGKVTGWETVKVPAGEFRALKIERVMLLGDYETYRSQTRLTEHEWYVPELRGAVKLQSWEEFRETGDHRYLQGERQVYELLSYQPGTR